MVSAVITSNGGQKYITSSDFDTAPSITFLWVKTFGFGFYAPAVLPFLIGVPPISPTCDLCRRHVKTLPLLLHGTPPPLRSTPSETSRAFFIVVGV